MDNTLVQKIADAVVPMLWIGDDEADSRARVESAIRQSLADASGAVVAYTDGHGMLWLPGERVTMSGTPIPLFAHPASSADRVAHIGDSKFESWFSTYDPAGNGSKQQARDAYAAGMNDPSADRVAELEAQLAESQEREGRMREALEKVQPLARRTLWLAFVWNDHNFTHPLDYARSEAKQQGFKCLEDAQVFLADLSKDMAFAFALKPQQAADQEKT